MKTETTTETVTLTREQLELVIPALSSASLKWRDLAEEEGISEDRKRIRHEIAEDMWELYATLDGYRNR